MEKTLQHIILPFLANILFNSRIAIYTFKSDSESNKLLRFNSDRARNNGARSPPIESHLSFTYHQLSEFLPTVAATFVLYYDILGTCPSTRFAVGSYLCRFFYRFTKGYTCIYAWHEATPLKHRSNNLKYTKINYNNDRVSLGLHMYNEYYVYIYIYINIYIYIIYIYLFLFIYFI